MNGETILLAVAATGAGFALGWLAASLRGKSERAAVELAAAGELRRLGEERAREAEAARRVPFVEEKLREREEELESARGERSALAARLAAAEARASERDAALDEKLALLGDAEKRFREAFEALSAEALRNNNDSFLNLAGERLGKVQEGLAGELDLRKQAVEQMLSPIRERLDRLDDTLQRVDREREGTLAQLRSVDEAQRGLREETGRLVSALRTPQVRGRWGELQLRKVMEMAGMLKWCDFVEQTEVPSDGERKLRPDVLVNLPGGKLIVVDAKAPLSAYLDSLETKDEAAREVKLAEHARLVRDHIRALGRKSYSDGLPSAPEFVVMFLPGEVFFSAALQADPKLIELGVEENVIPASPTTLISLMRAVAYGWRQEQIAKSAQEISENGRLLYERIAKVAEHLDRLGKSLDGAVRAYNDSIGSIERNVLPAARRFRELGSTASGELESPRLVETARRLPAAAEISPGAAEPED